LKPRIWRGGRRRKEGVVGGWSGKRKCDFDKPWRKAMHREPGFEPYFSYLIFVGVGVGTSRMGMEARLTILWSVLLGLSLLHAGRRPIESGYSLPNLCRGAALGLISSLPLLFLASDLLSVTSLRLFPLCNVLSLFRCLVFLAAPVEELYFRAILQRERGVIVASLLYGLSGAVFFLPLLRDFFFILVAVMAAMGLLGFIYGYVYVRYGLFAAIACHAVVNFLLLYLPVMLK
jgi:membrane protease YdiL (CAAX protease family)